MTVDMLRKKIERRADDPSAMANEAISSSSDLLEPSVEFAEPDAVVEKLIKEGGSIWGRIAWQGGYRAPFEAKVDGEEVWLRIGPIEIPD